MVDGAGLHGSTVDNHFTVLPFITGEGEAVLCAIILKSEKDVTDIPINWRYGIDVMQPVLNPGTTNTALIHEGEVNTGTTCCTTATTRSVDANSSENIIVSRENDAVEALLDFMSDTQLPCENSVTFQI
jgi:hypothetical protein